MSKKGKLIIYTGFSGVGKGTIMKIMLEKEKNFRLSVSVTTRDPRPGEIDGVHYSFVTEEEFNKMIENDSFLEYAVYSDNSYGTPKKSVEDLLNSGYDVFLEIEVQGGLQVMKKRPDALSIFIVPPTMEELERRLRGRGTEDEETIKKRLNAVEFEKQFKSEYQYIIVNDVAEKAADEIINIVHSKK